MERIFEIKKISQILADEKRLKILVYLLENSATVSELVENLEIDQPRVSSHLAILLESELVSFEATGRQRFYYIQNKEKVSKALDSIYNLNNKYTQKSIKRSKQAEKLVQENSPIRQARTCYDHLAGVIGVQMLDLFLENGWLVAKNEDNKTNYFLTDYGKEKLSSIGINIRNRNNSKRKFAYGCLDWTERKFHLGGLLGYEILNYMEKNDYIVRRKTDRSLIVNKTPKSLFSFK